MEVRINEFHNDLYCFYCKEKIELGEKYVVVKEEMYDGEIVEKYYHLDEMCTPETEEDDLMLEEEEEL